MFRNLILLVERPKLFPGGTAYNRHTYLNYQLLFLMPRYVIQLDFLRFRNSNKTHITHKKNKALFLYLIRPVWLQTSVSKQKT